VIIGGLKNQKQLKKFFPSKINFKQKIQL